MKKIFFLLLLCSPILVLLINKKADLHPINDTFFGKRTENSMSFIRGAIVGINKKDRIVTLKTQDIKNTDIFVPTQTEFYIKLRSSLGGESKKFAGDYFNRLENGLVVDVELSGETVFAKRILIYDLENFNY